MMNKKEVAAYIRRKEAEQIARAREAALKAGTITKEESDWLFRHESIILPPDWQNRS